MSISSSEVTTSATLEQFRVEFNNLVSDVKGLESGAASFSNIEIKEDGGLTFEGATNDNFETLITVTDPTADRTIKLPNQSGTLPVLAADSDTAITSTPAELNIMDGGTSASSITVADADRLVINDDGTMKQVALSDVKTYLNSAGYVTDDPTALAIALG